jgi:uncharacterized protein (DUF4415 family)
MSENKPVIGSDLARVDAHVVGLDEYEDIPELADAFFERADHYVGERLVRRGRPRSPAPKKAVNLRLDQDVLERFRSGGPGWQSRINEVLRKAAGL